MDNNITNSHDKLFKEVYSNKLNAISFLENYLPEKILELTDLDSLELCKDSFIEKNLQKFYSDMENKREPVKYS
ncbi:MAG: Rpn family recombination-promoting nuclease/putative transposase [Desulfobacterales bacterium]|nr:Rpn family recombination-promoting nuclease/putative transposase [Desulfobacterales bacterium]